MQVTITSKPNTVEPARRAAKRAWAYLRVSSEGQVNTGYSRDGLSIDSQRDEARRKATQLDAEIVRTFLDPGRSAFVDLHKRTDFLEMLEELKQCNEHEATRIEYVIVWSTSRWARDVRVHFDAHDLVKTAGARLVSITEPMIGEDTPESFLFEGMQAVNNQYESMRTGRAVKGGLHRKAMAGGSYGGRRLGYIKSIEQLPDGRQVSAPALDPDRHHFITLAFQLYASGEYSISQLVNELYRAGLRSYPTRRYPEGKVGTAALQRLLRNPYYAGQLVYKRGTPDAQVFEGRHPRLIDQATFDLVQTRLDEKRLAGERPQKRRHYLRGSVFCGDCGHRLIYGFSRGKSGQRYPYFFCVSRTRGSNCAMHTSITPKLIEQAIERYYALRPVQLSAEQVRRRTEAIESLVAVSQQAVSQIKDAKTRLIRTLEAKQDALVDMRFSEKSISASVFKRKQATLDDELDAAHASLAETEGALQLNATHLRIALELAEDVAAVYQGGNQQLKRGYNQAFFRKLYVTPEWDEAAGQMAVRITGAELTEPYALLLADDLAEDMLAEAEAIKAQATQRAPESQSGSPKPFASGCSIFVKMAERGGFEPPNEVSPVTRFPVAPVQPLRHLSMDGSPICDRRRHDKATTPAPISLVGSPHGPRRKRSFRQDVRPRRHLRRHRHRRQPDHRLHRDPGPRRATPEPGIPGIASAARQLTGLAHSRQPVGPRQLSAPDRARAGGPASDRARAGRKTASRCPSTAQRRRFANASRPTPSHTRVQKHPWCCSD
jgi:site-specific DNA recombinase